MKKLKRVIMSIIAVSVCIPCIEAQIDADKLMRIGANTHYFEDYVLSIQYFNRVISMNPNQARPYFYRSVAKLNLDDYAGAEEDASLAIERNPFIVEAYEVRGIARQNLNRFKEAIEDYDRSLENYPDNSGILFNKALAQYDSRDTVGASETLELLIRKFPKYENAYTGRARLRLERNDTVGALADIDKALKINSNTLNAYILRADIAIKSGENVKSALADMDIALKIQPNSPGLYVNRAYLRYMNDDLRGAFEDYDRALEIDPNYSVALFNRGLLRAEVHDTNRAIEDFSSVLKLNPSDYKTLYNRAILLAETGDFNKALEDIDVVIERFPDFAAAYFLRFDIRRRKGDVRNAKKDYDRSLSLAKTQVQLPADKQFSEHLSSSSDDVEIQGETEGDSPNASKGQSNVKYESQEQVKRRFSSLSTVSDNFNSTIDYSTASEIRGKVQDKEIKYDTEPYFLITYYTSPTELKLDGEYIKEVDDLNMTHLLRFGLQVANRESSIAGEDHQALHRSSIEYYNSYISTHQPRAIDYFGRAMDFMTLKDFQNAEKDLSKAIDLTPDFSLAYILRAQALYLQATDPMPRLAESASMKGCLERALKDLNEVERLSPSMPIASYNKGLILSIIGRTEDALKAFSRAIKLKSDFGEAYFNRGYLLLSLGEASKAFPDLSRAGELGIVPAYSLLKRMTAQ